MLTYRVPASLCNDIKVGARVIVPLGKRKFYTAIVIALQSEAPEGEFALKEITELVDTTPLILPVQLRLWQWVAEYYMCSLGEVMKAALPAGLKLESEMRLTRADDFADADTFLPIETAVWQTATKAEGTPLSKIQERIGRGATAAVRRLIERGALIVEEKMLRSFRPRTETHVRLAEAYRTEEALNALLSTLTRAKKQEELLLRYLELSGIATLSLTLSPLAKEVAKVDLLASDYSEAAFQTLRQKGVFETYPYEVERLKTLQALPDALKRQLSPAQQTAKADIKNVFQSKTACLLHGVTSSGKTELYV